MLMNIGESPRMSTNGLLTTVAWSSEDGTDYAIEGSIYIAGAVVQWMRDELGIIEESAETESMALRVEDTGGCYFVPSFVGLGAPYWDQNARGMIMGLTRSPLPSRKGRIGVDCFPGQRRHRGHEGGFRRGHQFGEG